MALALAFAIVAIWILLGVARAPAGGIGKRGERSTLRHLRSLDPVRYMVLDDVMLPSKGYSSTTQIDHIVVSNYGIFCIETKGLKGWIFGNAHQEQWTQVLFRYKGRFYSTLHNHSIALR